MHDEPPELGRLLLLGEDYGQYGGLASAAVGRRGAAAISVGTDPQSPSGRFKDDPTVPNEDAVCVIDAGSWFGLAVADAHYGPEASHLLVSRLHDLWAKVRPTDLGHLDQMVEFLRNGEPARTESETTLLVAVFDRDRGEGFGLSFGDSTLTVAGPERSPVPLNPQDHRFVTPADARSLRGGGAFRFRGGSGDLVLAFTDGIDGCHYRSPDTSVRPEHVAAIAAERAYAALPTIDDIAVLALRGVDGNPGGQDNVVIAGVEI